MNVRDNQKVSTNKKRLITVWYPYAIITGIGFFLYIQTLSFDFTTHDDSTLVQVNYVFNSNLSNLPTAFTTPIFYPSQVTEYFRPLYTVSFMFDSLFNGPKPFMFHLSNILLHLLASCLVFVFLKKLSVKKNPALFCSLLFTVHPALTQAIAWIPGRNDSLLAIVILLSFISLINGTTKQQLRWHGIHLLMFGFAMLIKESAIVFPFICILYLTILTNEKIFSRKYYMVYAGWCVIIIGWFFSRTYALQSVPHTSVITSLMAIFNNLPAIFVYLGKIVFPVHLSTYAILADSPLTAGIITAFVLIIAAILSREGNKRLFFFGLVCFLGFLLPSFTRPNTSVSFDFLEHRIYLPMIGFFIMALSLHIPQKFSLPEKMLLPLQIICIAVFAALTFAHSKNFQNGERYWKSAVETSPHAEFAHEQLGNLLQANNMTAEALNEYQTILTINPSNVNALNNAAVLYHLQGNNTKAIEYLNNVVSIDSHHTDAYNNLGLLYDGQKDYDKSITCFIKIISLDVTNAEAYRNIANEYSKKRDFPIAIENFKHAAQLGDVKAQYFLKQQGISW